MGQIQSYRDLEVWQAAMDAVVNCYALTDRYPPSERYALTRETRRSVVSVPSNIAEGHNRHATNAYLNHVNIALGSVAELETQVEIAVRLKFVQRSEIERLDSDLRRIGRMLRRLQQALEAKKRAAFVAGMSCLVIAAFLLR